jgi:hypothetical protein
VVAVADAVVDAVAVPDAAVAVAVAGGEDDAATPAPPVNADRPGFISASNAKGSGSGCLLVHVPDAGWPMKQCHTLRPLCIAPRLHSIIGIRFQVGSNFCAWYSISKHKTAKAAAIDAHHYQLHLLEGVKKLRTHFNKTESKKRLLSHLLSCVVCSTKDA